MKGTTVREGDWVTLNGSKGTVYVGALPLIKAAGENPDFVAFMALCDKVKKLGVRTNADTPQDAKKAREFGAEGIGLFRFEHMFYGEGSDRPLFLLRRMIASKTEAERRKALEELFPFMKEDVKRTMEVMDGLPVTFRFLDPPLHEFVPTPGRGEAAAGHGPGHLPRGVQQAGGRPARVQPDDGPPRRAPGHLLPRDDRGPGPRHPRGRRRADQGRQERAAGDHDPGHLAR